MFQSIHEWFYTQPQLYVAFKVIVGFIVLLFVSRIIGKKELAQYTPLDFIFIIALSGLLEETIYHKDTKWFWFFTGIFLWLGVFMLTDKLSQHSKRVRSIVKGKPTFLIKDGELIEDALLENKLELEEVRHALRSKGVFSLFDVKHAILETNGKINVIQYQDQYNDYPLMIVENGEFVLGTVKELDRDSLTRLKDELKKLGQDDITNVYYAEMIGDNFYFKLKGGGDNGAVDRKTN